ITASTLTTIVVFLPIVFISGIVGNIFTEFALAVAFSLIASLFVAFTVVPMIASRVLTRPAENTEIQRQQSSSRYFLERSVDRVLEHRFMTTFIEMLLVITGGVGVAKTGVDFLPQTDEGFFTIDMELENGAELDKTTDNRREIEELLDKENDVKDYMAIAGSYEDTAYMSGL